MKNKLTFALCLTIGIAIVACNKQHTPATPKTTTHSTLNQTPAYRLPADTTDTMSSFIPISVANDMINSYLVSINGNANDSDLKSFTVNADTLRAYLSNTSIKRMKICLAHTKAYINEGYYGVNAGYQAGAITLVFAGYDVSGNYVYNNGMVLDHCVPCPTNCPSGQAGGNNLQ